MTRINANLYIALTAQIARLECEIEATETMIKIQGSYGEACEYNQKIVILVDTLDRMKVRRERVSK